MIPITKNNDQIIHKVSLHPWWSLLRQDLARKRSAYWPWVKDRIILNTATEEKTEEGDSSASALKLNARIVYILPLARSNNK